jgi:hypothetical protein
MSACSDIGDRIKVTFALSRSGSAAALGLGRITVFGLWLALIAPAPMALYSELPVELFMPVGIFRLLPTEVYHLLLNARLLWVFKAALVMGCGLLVLGVRPYRPLAVPTCLMILFYDGLMKGFNAYINHSQIVLLYGTMIIALFPAGDGLSIMGRKYPLASPNLYVAPILMIAFILCLTYSFIGTRRIVRGGLAIFQGEAILTYMATRSLQHSLYGFAYGLLPLSYPLPAPAFKIGYAITTVFEILSPLCLIWTWFRRVWVPVILLFHVVTLLTMNIFFWENILLILVFIPAIGYIFGGAKQCS